MKKYLKLFLTTLYISAFTFGGGYVIVSLMKKKFADELGWIDEEEMLNLVAIAQSSPGAVAVNASLLVGKKIGGVIGACVAVLATIIPPFVIISIISYFYQAFASNFYVACVLRGMQAGVCAVIIDVVINLSRNIIKEKKALPIIMIGLAFVATYFLGVNLIIIIFVCGFIGAISARKQPALETAGEADEEVVLPDMMSAEFSGSHEEDEVADLQEHIEDSQEENQEGGNK